MLVGDLAEGHIYIYIYIWLLILRTALAKQPPTKATVHSIGEKHDPVTSVVTLLHNLLCQSTIPNSFPHVWRLPLKRFKHH